MKQELLNSVDILHYISRSAISFDTSRRQTGGENLRALYMVELKKKEKANIVEALASSGVP